MRIEHVGLWVRDIDAVAAFYAKYFGARVGELYQNPRKGFESRFLEFGGGARLEIMTRTDVERSARPASSWALRTWRSPSATKPAVDALAARFAADGIAAGSTDRGAPAMATTNAWCAIRKAIAWKSRR